MSTHGLFPARIETDRLVFERFCHDAVDPFEVYAFVTRTDWKDGATEHMPWFALGRVDEVPAFVDVAQEQWATRERARHLLRRGSDGQIVGLTTFDPDWEARRAGSDVVLARDYWGNEDGVERASVFVKLTFETDDLDAYYTTCAAGNDPSRRMIEKVIERYGGRHEGLLRQHSPRPDGTVTDQHRFTILRDEYEDARGDRETKQFAVEW